VIEGAFIFSIVVQKLAGAIAAAANCRRRTVCPTSSLLPLSHSLWKYWSNLSHVKGDGATGVETSGEGCENPRERERERERENYFYAVHVQPRARARNPHPASNYSPVSPLPFYPKIQKRGDLLVCAEAEQNAWGRLRPLSRPCVRAIRSSHLAITTPSKPNSSLTKPFLFGNLFCDRGSLSRRPLSPVTIAIYRANITPRSRLVPARESYRHRPASRINYIYERERER